MKCARRLSVPESQRTIETYDITEAALKIVIGEKREAVPGRLVHPLPWTMCRSSSTSPRVRKAPQDGVCRDVRSAVHHDKKGTRAEANAAAKEYLAIGTPTTTLVQEGDRSSTRDSTLA